MARVVLIPTPACARFFVRVQAGKWDRKKFKGSELSGKTIGIVGLGNIGRQVAKYCQQFGMRTVGYDPILTPAAAEKLGIEMVRAVFSLCSSCAPSRCAPVCTLSRMPPL